ncbi:hypothetical protein AB1E18_010447 [Capra hircus]
MVPPHVPGARPQHVPGDRAGTSRNAGRWGTAPGRTCAREGRTDRRAASSWPGYGGARPPPTGGTKLGRTPGSREGLPNRGVATELSPPTRSSASTGSSAFLATRCGASWWAGRAPPEASLRWSAADRGARAPAPPGPQSHPGKSPRDHVRGSQDSAQKKQFGRRGINDLSKLCASLPGPGLSGAAQADLSAGAIFRILSVCRCLGFRRSPTPIRF